MRLDEVEKDRAVREPPLRSIRTLQAVWVANGGPPHRAAPTKAGFQSRNLLKLTTRYSSPVTRYSLHPDAAGRMPISPGASDCASTLPGLSVGGGFTITGTGVPTAPLTTG